MLLLIQKGGDSISNKIKVRLIGADTSNGIKIIKNINKLQKQIEYTLLIDKIDSKDKEKYNIKIIPTLLIDGFVVSSGNVPSDRELKNFIKKLKEA